MKIRFVLIFVFLFATIHGIAQDEAINENIVRVMTFNILHGATTKGDFDLDKLASVIKQADPDLVALQEVDYKTKRAKKYDLATELGWRTGMSPVFGQAMPFDGGGYGVGILSKKPIISSQNKPLPSTRGNEPRTSLEVLTKTNKGDTIRFICTHLDYKTISQDRINQVKALNEKYIKNDYPTILAGDLNATPESESISILKQFWTDSFGDHPQATYPSDDPGKKIDYILFRPGTSWEVLENKVICDRVASDHCVVLSVLRLIQ